MSKNDPRYFKAYYEKNKKKILEHRRKRYATDEEYRNKVRTRAYFFRRLVSIVKYVEHLLSDWRKGTWQEKKKSHK
jgi:hypothetical protein